MKTSDLTKLALLTALALVLGYVENMFPIAPTLPGVKLGLSNTVLLYGVYLLGFKYTFILMILKVGLSGLMFSGVSAMLFSFGGGLLSLIVMIVAKSLLKDKISVVGLSVLSAVFHNVGQVFVASLVVETLGVLAYVPVLLVSAVVTGFLTGNVARLILRATKD